MELTFDTDWWGPCLWCVGRDLWCRDLSWTETLLAWPPSPRSEREASPLLLLHCTEVGRPRRCQREDGRGQRTCTGRQTWLSTSGDHWALTWARSWTSADQGLAGQASGPGGVACSSFPGRDLLAAQGAAMTQVVMRGITVRLSYLVQADNQ